jgi:hypothetical protein
MQAAVILILLALVELVMAMHCSCETDPGRIP